MSLTSAMLVGQTGLESNQFAIDTIGNNISNVNTTAFKRQRSIFQDIFYLTLNEGSGPVPPFGGTNPMQIGYGSSVASLQRIFTQGVLDPTGLTTDLAVEGNGFFVLKNSSSAQVFTRDGAFDVNQTGTLVSTDGLPVQGFAADGDGNIIAGTLVDLTIPVGTQRAAVATTQALLDGNLDASSTVAAQPAVVTSGPLATAGGTAATESTALTDLVDDAGVPLFAAGDVVTIDGWQKGGVELPAVQFVVGADVSSLGDLASFIETRAGINTDPSLGGTAGVTVQDGALVIVSNLGEPNAVSLAAADVRNSTSGELPFTFSGTPAAGQGTTTSFLVYDSLGNPVEVRIRAALESSTTAGNVWRFFAESADDTDDSPIVGTGTISFDQNGRFLSATGADISIDRAGTGAASPLTVALDFSSLTGLSSPAEGSTLVMATQNGSTAGELIDFAVTRNGLIVGTFSNGATQVFGQVALATFANNEGLVAEGNNLFVPGANSGEAMIGAPLQMGRGSIESGNLELSNVELTREFIGLLNASTGFSAATRVIRTADDLLQELLLLLR